LLITLEVLKEEDIEKEFEMIEEIDDEDEDWLWELLKLKCQEAK
jgi:hypothetical protein